MNLSKTNMKVLAEILGITDLTDFTIRNRDAEDGKVVIGRDTIVPTIRTSLSSRPTGISSSHASAAASPGALARASSTSAARRTSIGSWSQSQ